jgi:hypothetical protein
MWIWPALAILSGSAAMTLFTLRLFQAGIREDDRRNDALFEHLVRKSEAE